MEVAEKPAIGEVGIPAASLPDRAALTVARLHGINLVGFDSPEGHFLNATSERMRSAQWGMLQLSVSK